MAKDIQPLYALTHLLIQTPEVSELDQRVLNELLSDPSFMKSLEARGVQAGDSEKFDEEKRPSRNMDVNQQSPTYGALASGGMMAPNASYRNSTSGFESATMQVVEKLQISLRGVLAKVSATLESAGETLQSKIFDLGPPGTLPLLCLPSRVYCFVKLPSYLLAFAVPRKRDCSCGNVNINPSCGNVNIPPSIVGCL